ncbi:conserved exported protein of unknown function [Nitrospira japonica]|uniref:Uncharacterized protein n=1 Tax=Nitrospira japonica TaxID=1325564 RepID=A0A1W1I409_9BACT|nr:hypothetical protein [Nitrospira japonica]SLM47740.1 conserved exported protein of unknown function [Nitrospira japonica]
MLAQRLRCTRPAAPVVIFLAVTAAFTSAQATPAIDDSIFPRFSRHVIRYVQRDKVAFAQASTCLSWFYKGTKTPPPVVQGIHWQPSAFSKPEKDCPAIYPKGMDAARDDFAKTQAQLSIGLTVYELALVADRNDDYTYNATELRDLFASLSLTLDPSDPTQGPVATLTERFDRWYQVRSLDEVMTGMSLLYDQGYRVTAGDRADLDRIMK